MFFIIICSLNLKVKFQGVTGEVQFDQVTGERRLHNGLDILNIAEDEVKKVCHEQSRRT